MKELPPTPGDWSCKAFVADAPSEAIRLADLLEEAARQHMLSLLFVNAKESHKRAYGALVEAADAYRKHRQSEGRP